jgi:hypothetical protein
MLSPLAGGMLGPLAEGRGVRAFWASAARVSVSDRTLTRNDGGNNWSPGAGACSSLTLSGAGWVSYVVSSLGVVLGLSYGNPGTTRDEIDYGLLAGGDGRLYVARGGSFADVTPCSVSDVLEVEWTGAQMRYKRNGVAVAADAISVTYPLLVDCSIYYNGASISGVLIGGAWS